MKVLFVCTGNTCRSVLAEQLFRKMVSDRGLRWKAHSCGTAGDPTLAVPDLVRRLLAEQGAGNFHHQSRPVSPVRVRWADLILTMTDTQMRALWTAYPEAKAKTHLLREKAGLGPEDIEDPIGLGEDAYRRALAKIREALHRVISQNEKPPGPGPLRGSRPGKAPARARKT